MRTLRQRLSENPEHAQLLRNTRGAHCWFLFFFKSWLWDTHAEKHLRRLALKLQNHSYQLSFGLPPKLYCNIYYKLIQL